MNRVWLDDQGWCFTIPVNSMISFFWFLQLRLIDHRVGSPSFIGCLFPRYHPLLRLFLFCNRVISHSEEWMPVAVVGWSYLFVLSFIVYIFYDFRSRVEKELYIPLFLFRFLRVVSFREPTSWNIGTILLYFNEGDYWLMRKNVPTNRQI